MRKRVLTIRGVPDSTVKVFRAEAKRSRRSLNSELLVVLENAAKASVTLTGPPVAVREPLTMAYAAGNTAATKRIDGIDRDALAAICRRYHIKSLALFGSRAEGLARNDSDIDVLAEFEPGMTPGFGIVAVADALRPILGGTVDLVTRRGLSPRFLRRILPTAVPLYHAE